MDYNKYVANRVKGVSFSTIRYFFNLASQMPDAISLCIGEPDFVTPSHIREAAKKSLDEGKTSYTPNPGIIELRREIADYLERRFGLTYNPEKEIIVTIGASEAIDVAMRTLINPGDEVLIPEPAFVSYGPCAVLAGGKPVPVPTYMKDGFSLKPEVLEKFVTPKSKVLVLNFPNNPTGAVMSWEELGAIAKVAEKRDLIVVSDEVYAELTYGVEHVAVASIPGMRERTVTIGGFSKAYSMTGWRLGYIAAPEGLASEFLKVHQYSVACAPSMAQYAAVEALRNGDEDIKRMREEYDRRRMFVYNSLKDMGLECVEPKGAFYIFPSIEKTGLSSEEFASRLFDEVKVAVVPGIAFGESGQGFIRISYAASMENLERAMERIDQFLKRI